MTIHMTARTFIQFNTIIILGVLWIVVPSFLFSCVSLDVCVCVFFRVHCKMFFTSSWLCAEYNFFFYVIEDNEQARIMSKYLKHLLIFFPLIQFVLEISLCVYMNFFCCYSQFDFFFFISTQLYSTLLSFGIFHFIRCVRLPLWPIVVWWFGFILALLQPFTFHCESRQMVSYWIQFNGWLMCMCFRQYWLRPNQIFRRFNECHTNRFVYCVHVLCAVRFCES